jgi:ribonuclease P protein component
MTSYRRFHGARGSLLPSASLEDSFDETNVSAQQAPAPAHAWLSGAHEVQERAPRAETSARQGPEALDGIVRVTHVRHPGRPPAAGATLGGRERIKRRADFRKVYDQGVRATGRLLTLFILPNGLPVARLGIAAGRKIGGAVRRNRAKRLIREVFRRNKPAPGIDVVIVPRREVIEAPLSALEADYLGALKRRRHGTR